MTDSFRPPPVSPALVARARVDHATAQELSAGRSLFAGRCLNCHTLPRTTAYSREQWTDLVSRMAARANLTPAEQRSVLAYLRAAATH
ncbi:MAG: hypothetical protein ACR2FX_10065 [Chthoniobacterales bacterium]